MADEDSYSHESGIPAYLGSPKTRALMYQSSCLQKRAIQDLYNQALLLQCMKYLPAYQKSLNTKRVMPPVPKFEEFEETQKKVKPEITEPLTMTRLYPVNGINLPKAESGVEDNEGLGRACGSNSSNSANWAKTSETLQFQDFMTSHAKEQCGEFVNQGDLSPESVKTEDTDNVKIEATSDDQDFMVAPLQSVTTSTAISLDRKEKKKFQKFVELCEDYQTKLKISNALVFEKFKQLATLVIPRLLSHFKSKPFEAVAAAILLYACREVDYPITLKQIVSITDSKEKLINKCVFSLKEILPSNAEVKHFKAGEFINVLADKLKLNGHVRAAAIKIWENIEKLNFMKSIHAVTLAACCLKFACSLSDSDKDFETLAMVAGITKMTLKNMYRELFPYRFYFITADCRLRDPAELKGL